MDSKWSTFQEDIFGWSKSPTEDLMVMAGAGCGKTTTIVELYKRIKANEPLATILFFSFNVKIKDELVARGVPAVTMNGFGTGIVYRNFHGITLETNKVRFLCRKHGVDFKKQGLVQRCIDLMKNYLIPLPVMGDGCVNKVREIISDFELTEDEVDALLVAKIVEIFRDSLMDRHTMDFADQLAYPVYHKMGIMKYDYVFVDETQDMSPLKLQLVASAVGKRFICVGDPYQAIYGFAGADSESMNRVRDQFDPIVKSLPVTYRCGKTIVAEAHKHKVAPADFQAGPNNHEGEVKDISREEFETLVKPKDFVLCRVTSPLVSYCFKLIKKGVRAQILGKDVGKKLSELVDKIDGTISEHTVDKWCEAYSRFKQQEVGRLRAADKDNQADNLEDQLECLWVFTESVVSIMDIKARIEKMFDDKVNPDSVIFSTIHKSKGLEAETVFCLPYKARPAKKDKQKREEANLLYVQITRAKNQLFWVK